MRFARVVLPVMAALCLAAPAVHASAADDKAIVNAVRAKLNATDPEASRGVEIDAKDGVVTLKGIALTPGEMVRALQQARTVRGVVKVVNRLVLR